MEYTSEIKINFEKDIAKKVVEDVLICALKEENETLNYRCIDKFIDQLKKELNSGRICGSKINEYCDLMDEQETVNLMYKIALDLAYSLGDDFFSMSVLTSGTYGASCCKVFYKDKLFLYGEICGDYDGLSENDYYDLSLDDLQISEEIIDKKLNKDSSDDEVCEPEEQSGIFWEAYDKKQF